LLVRVCRGVNVFNKGSRVFTSMTLKTMLASLERYDALKTVPSRETRLDKGKQQ